MKLRNLLGALLLGATALTAGADDHKDVRKEINRIKKNSSYLYAEATAPSEANARSAAELKLFDAISEWVEGQRKVRNSSNLIVNNRSELWTSLSMPRGSNMYRYFIYVKKKDIIPTDNAVVIANPKQPAVDKQLQDEIPAPIAELAACKRYADLAAKLKVLESQGKLKHYARYANLTNPETNYLFIYNRDGDVVAVLTPGAERTNVRTGKADGIVNYRGCGAIGVEF